MTTENENPKAEWQNPFADPFKSGLIKADAIDKIMANPELMAIINKIKL